MIIFGTRGVTSTKESGFFNCPECGTKKIFKHREVRRFFTLYFIPVIPLDHLGEYIECGSCNNTFNLSVLNYKPQTSSGSVEAEFYKGIRLSMVEMVLADGKVEDSEISMLQEIYKKLTGKEISIEEIRAEIEKQKTEESYVKKGLQKLAGLLNDEGKELVIKAGVMVAMADGEFHDSEKDLLLEMATSLGLTKSHFNGIIRGMMED